MLLNHVSCGEKLLEGTLVHRGLRFRARGDGQEGTPLWNIVKQLSADWPKNNGFMRSLKVEFSTYSLRPVISQADLKAVELGIARSQVRIRDMPPAARDLKSLGLSG